MPPVEAAVLGAGPGEAAGGGTLVPCGRAPRSCGQGHISCARGRAPLSTCLAEPRARPPAAGCPQTHRGGAGGCRRSRAPRRRSSSCAPRAGGSTRPCSRRRGCGRPGHPGTATRRSSVPASLPLRQGDTAHPRGIAMLPCRLLSPACRAPRCHCASASSYPRCSGGRSSRRSRRAPCGSSPPAASPGACGAGGSPGVRLTARGTGTGIP